jgi:hypothetical protein
MSVKHSVFKVWNVYVNTDKKGLWPDELILYDNAPSHVSLAVWIF